MFDPNANSELVAARAAELSLEQIARLDAYITKHGLEKATDFYEDPFEIHICNEVARLMAGYAKLKGYVK